MKSTIASTLFLFVAAPCFSADETKTAFTLKDVAWFAGHWREKADKRLQEETWTDAAGGAMVGSFRLVVNDKPAIYEFLLIEENADGVFMLLRHFRSGMAELEQKPIKLKLVKANANNAVFENPDGDAPKRITYARNNEDALTVTVLTTRNGKPSTFVLNFKRVAK